MPTEKPNNFIMAPVLSPDFEVVSVGTRRHIFQMELAIRDAINRLENLRILAVNSDLQAVAVRLEAVRQNLRDVPLLYVSALDGIKNDG